MPTIAQASRKRLRQKQVAMGTGKRPIGIRYLTRSNRTKTIRLNKQAILKRLHEAYSVAQAS